RRTDLRPRQFGPRTFGPQHAAQIFEYLQGLAESRCGSPVLTPLAQQLAEEQLGARTIERHWQPAVLGHRFMKHAFGSLELTLSGELHTAATAPDRQHPRPVK